MTTATARRAIHDQIAHQARWGHGQADAEGRALRGEFGPERQVTACSAFYLQLRAAGHPSTGAIRAAAVAGDFNRAAELIFAAIAGKE